MAIGYKPEGFVALFTSAWIETTSTTESSGGTNVALFTSAWIETPANAPACNP